jgi:hypothetical protein
MATERERKTAIYLTFGGILAVVLAAFVVAMATSSGPSRRDEVRRDARLEHGGERDPGARFDEDEMPEERPPGALSRHALAAAGLPVDEPDRPEPPPGDVARPRARDEAAEPAHDGPSAGEPAPDAAPTATLSREGVQAAIQAVKPKIRACYEEALAIQPGLAGTLQVTFALEQKDGRGTVVSGEIADSEMKSPFFEACVLKQIAGADFEAPTGDGVVSVTYPFHFDEVEPAEAAGDGEEAPAP